MSSVNLKRQKELNAQMSEVMDDFDRFEYFCARHWKKFVGAAIAIVVIVAVFFSLRAWNQSRNDDAAAAFGKAKNAEELSAALAEYGSFDAANPARLKLATLYVQAKDFAKAREVLAEAAKADVPEIAWRAKLNLAAVAELEGKVEDAANAYADFFRQETDPAGGTYRLEAAVAAGRLYLKAGKTDAARDVLESGRALAQDNPAAQGFAVQLNSLLAQLPASAQ